MQRAIEVYLQTGRSIVDQKDERPNHTKARAACASSPSIRRAIELYQRINERTEAHFSAGLVDEVRSCWTAASRLRSNALGAHGYRRVVEYLQGLRDLDERIEQTKLDVRHYAKRQLTWFRHEAGVEWFDGFGEENRILRSVLEAIAGGPRSK